MRHGRSGPAFRARLMLAKTCLILSNARVSLASAAVSQADPTAGGAPSAVGGAERRDARRLRGWLRKRVAIQSRVRTPVRLATRPRRRPPAPAARDGSGAGVIRKRRYEAMRL